MAEVVVMTNYERAALFCFVALLGLLIGAALFGVGL